MYVCMCKKNTYKVYVKQMFEKHFKMLDDEY